MIELLSMLLYLELICSPCTYTEVQIENKEVIYQEEIISIENDPVLYDQVINEFHLPASEVVIIYEDEEYK